MGLLRRALLYRERYLREHGFPPESGLLNKTLKYLGLRKIKKNNNSNNKQDQKSSSILKYYEILDNISKDLLKISFEKDSKKDFNNIISSHYNFKKNIFFIYSPSKEKFVYWTGKNINDKSNKESSFDLKFGNIFKKITKNNSLLLTPEDKDYSIFYDVLSKNDMDDSAFQLFVPFIFFGHIIGIFLGLKMMDGTIPDNDLINSLELLGRFNGALVYNIYHHESLNE